MMSVINEELIMKVIDDLNVQECLLSRELSEKQEKLDNMTIGTSNCIEYYELDTYVNKTARQLSYICDAILNLNHAIYSI